MARGPLDLWKEWATQILVLLSFTLQLMLLVLAGIRRREAPAVLRILLWFAYQLADSTAIYAIGHLSLGGTPSDHQLVAFWAPFLLLHLGGPDNITAYALEDSKLWLRHLLTVIVQVLGAAYVLYKHFTGSGRGNNSLLLASILMFIIGVIKYGERTWALRCGNIETIRNSLKKEPRTKCHFYLEDRPRQRSFKVAEADEDEYLVRRAHALFHICKLAVVDDYSVDEVGDTRDGNTFRHLTNEEKYAVMGMELSFMYDILYTKAGVIHTRRGYCIRVISPLATAGALLIFQFSGKAGQNRVDVTITYLLLAGAFFLEVTSLLRALGSSWTLNFLSTTQWSWLQHAALCSGRWDRFRRTIISLRHISNIMGISRYYISSRKWSGSMGQYNMLHFCTSRGTSYNRPLLGRLAKMLGQEDWWETKHYSGTVDVPDKVKELVFTHINWIFKRNDVNTLGIIRSDWGQQAMKRLGWELKRKYLGAEFQEGIIIWHISTELLLIRSKRAKDQETEHIVEAIKALSNYMMFLLVDRPDMLPGLAQKRLYERSWKFLYEEIWPKVIDDPTYHHRPSWNVCTLLKELFRLHDNPNSDSWRPHAKKLVSKLQEVWRNYVDETGLVWKTEASRVIFAIELTEKLIEEEKKSGRSLQLLLGMWTDFLVYAANRCSRESHAKKLNSGGELTTVLWLLTEHLYQVRSNN